MRDGRLSRHPRPVWSHDGRRGHHNRRPSCRRRRKANRQRRRDQSRTLGGREPIKTKHHHLVFHKWHYFSYLLPISEDKSMLLCCGKECCSPPGPITGARSGRCGELLRAGDEVLASARTCSCCGLSMSVDGGRGSSDTTFGLWMLGGRRSAMTGGLLVPLIPDVDG